MTPQDFLKLVSSRRFTLSGEKALQAEIEAALAVAGATFKREVVLGPGDIVDFAFPGGLVAEVKIKAQKRAIYRQCKRYCEHPSVTGLVLVTATALGFPEELEGKPCWVASLGRAWL